MLRRRTRVSELEETVARLERAVEKARRGALKDDRPQEVELDYPRARIVLDASTGLGAKRRHATRKEPGTVEWIESLPAGDVLYDVGANVGAYSLIAALRPQGPLRVVAFEPAFATYGVLCQNVVLNGAADAIVPLPVTLGERTELGRFAYRDLRAGAALHAGLAADPEAAYAQPVLVYGLDELVERFALPRPQHIKVDVDGAEPAVLRGAAGVLAAPSLRSALIELGARQEDEIEALMGAAGLRRIATHRGTEAAEDTVLYALYER